MSKKALFFTIHIINSTLTVCRFVFLMCMSVLPACIYVYHMSGWCPTRSEGSRCPGAGAGAGAKDGCELVCGF